MTRILCGLLHSDDAFLHPLLTTLPRLLHVRAVQSDAAARVGYESEAAFSRAFKRHLGEPPSVWRRSRARATSWA